MQVRKNIFAINTALIITIILFKVLTKIMLTVRGYEAIGGELIICIMVLVLVYRIVYRLLTYLQINYNIVIFGKKIKII